MLVRMQAGGYANLATISEAELHEDGAITLHWGAQHQRFTGIDAARVRWGLDILVGRQPMPGEAIVRSPQVEEQEQDPTRATGACDEEGGPPVLQLHARESPPAPLPDDCDPPVSETDEKPESALSRRADLVRGFEPIASLSHKHRGAFLAAIEKASDFNHLPPKYRRLLQEAEANRRTELRK